MSLTNLKVTKYGEEDPEEFTAANINTSGDFTMFSDGSGLVKAIRTADIKRIDRVPTG